MAGTNLLFTLLAWSGKSEILFAIAVIFDDIAAAFATVALWLLYRFLLTELIQQHNMLCWPLLEPQEEQHSHLHRELW